MLNVMVSRGKMFYLKCFDIKKKKCMQDGEIPID